MDFWFWPCELFSSCRPLPLYYNTELALELNYCSRGNVYQGTQTLGLVDDSHLFLWAGSPTSATILLNSETFIRARLLYYLF